MVLLMGYIWKHESEQWKHSRLLTQYNDLCDLYDLSGEVDEDLDQELLYEHLLILDLDKQGKNYDGILERRIRLFHGRTISAAGGQDLRPSGPPASPDIRG